MSADLNDRECANGPAPITPTGARGWAWLASKTGLSIMVLALMISRINVTALQPFDLSVPWLWLAAALLVASIAVAALRWSFLSQIEGAISAREAIVLSFAAQFVGQILPSSLGQDAIRGWLAVRGGRPPAPTVAIIAIDRVFGLVSLAILILAGAPFLVKLGGGAQAAGAGAIAGVVIAAGVICLAIVCIVSTSGAWPAWVQTMWRAARKALQLGVGSLALALSLIMHGAIVAAVWCIARAVGVELTPAEAFATIPVTIFVSQLPISVNGWGVREGAMVVSLGLAGVAASQALLISVLFGLTLLAASLPGAFALLAARMSRR